MKWSERKRYSWFSKNDWDVMDNKLWYEYQDLYNKWMKSSFKLLYFLIIINLIIWIIKIII